MYNNNQIIIIGDNSPNNDENNKQQNESNINYIPATECIYSDYLSENDREQYQKFHNRGCCGSGSNKIATSLLVYSIIILVLDIAGLFFLISKNKVYKLTKEQLEQDLKLVDKSLPDSSEMSIILNYFDMNKEFKNKIYYRKNCTYEYYRIGLCSYDDYQEYCDPDKYLENLCTYQDLYAYYSHYRYSYDDDFKCTDEKYSDKLCSYQQYLDYKNGYFDYFIYFGGKPKRFDIYSRDYSYSYYDDDDYYYNNNQEIDDSITIYNVKGISFEEFWCGIGKYDNSILMGLLIAIAFFIVLLIIDLCIKKDNIKNGIIYYIILILYMILYVVFRIFICLLFCLFAYSIIVTFYEPEPQHLGGKENDYRYSSYLDYYNLNFYNEERWEDRLINSSVFSGIVLLLFIFVSILDGLKALIIKYLGLDFDENQMRNEISRKISIRFGEEVHEIEVKNKQNVYLDEVTTRKKIKFKEIKFDKLGSDSYYLKLTNKGLVDQLGFSEWDYPHINEGFSRLGSLLDLIYVILFFLVLLTKFHVKDEYTYQFLKYAIELGYSISFSKYYEIYGNLEKNITELRIYVYLLITIILLLFMIKRAFFGGFKRNGIFWIFFIISLLFILLNLIILLITILIDVYTWLSFIAYISKITFSHDGLVFAKFIIQGCLNIIIIILQIAIFAKSISYTIFLYSMKKANDELANENKEDNIYNNSIRNKEEGFEFTALDLKPYFFQVINNTKLPKYLLYLKTPNRKRQIFIPVNTNIFISPIPIYVNNDNYNYPRINNPSNYNNYNNNDNNYNNSERLNLNNNNAPPVSNNNIIDNNIVNNKKNEEINNNEIQNINININTNDNSIEIINNNNTKEIQELKDKNKKLKDKNEEIIKKINYIRNQINQLLGRH